jgi:hypothetical protein
MVSKVSLTSSLWLQSIDTRKVRRSCQHANINFLAMQSQQQHQKCRKHFQAQKLQSTGGPAEVLHCCLDNLCHKEKFTAGVA